MALAPPVEKYGEMSLDELAAEFRGRIAGEVPETGGDLPGDAAPAGAPIEGTGDMSSQRIAQTKAGLKTRLGQFATPLPTEEI